MIGAGDVDGAERPLHVVLFADQHVETSGGAQVAMRLQRRFLERLGHTVTVVAPRRHGRDLPGAGDEAYVDIPSIPVPTDREYAFVWPGSRADRAVDEGIARRVARGAPLPDVVHVQADFWGAFLGVRFAERAGIPLVITMHNRVDAGIEATTPAPRLVLRALNAWRRWQLPGSGPGDDGWAHLAGLASRAAAVTAPSAHFARRLEEHGVFRPVDVVWNGIDDGVLADLGGGSAGAAGEQAGVARSEDPDVRGREGGGTGSGAPGEQAGVARSEDPDVRGSEGGGSGSGAPGEQAGVARSEDPDVRGSEGGGSGSGAPGRARPGDPRRAPGGSTGSGAESGAEGVARSEDPDAHGSESGGVGSDAGGGPGGGSGSGAPDGPAAPVRLVWVGRMSPEKRLLPFLEALAASGADARAEVIGAGFELAAARRLVAARGIAGRVDFLGRLPYRETLARVRAADALVQTSIGFETQGMTPFEAACLGTPAIVSDPDIADEMGGGVWRVEPAAEEPARVAALADALRVAVRDLRNGRAPRPAERVVREFRQSSRTDAMVAVYRRALAG
ncbi:glycosyltransferase [Microbacterium sp. gxy059]|uniref:glycosyltransferase n=1 Tax=Microbacterium sp. gxy059 TaxID=2957199 RepID=UPI003D955EE7